MLLSLWLTTVLTGICDFLSPFKVTIFIPNAMSRGGNYVNSSVVKCVL